MAVDARVLADVLQLMNQLADDWEYTEPITPDTLLLAELGLESLDLVVLGTTIQQRYGRLPFTEFLAEIGQRPVEQRDVTVSELVAFVCEYRVQIPAASAAG
jgi:acyl carrier protein